MMALIGLIIGTIGLDPVKGDARFTFGSMSLLSGIEFVAVAIGLFGKGKFEGAPLLLGLVLGPRMEVAFRQSLMISHGDFSTFTDRPISSGVSSGDGPFPCRPHFSTRPQTAEERRFVQRPCADKLKSRAVRAEHSPVRRNV